MKKTAQYYRQTFHNIEKRIMVVSHSLSPIARKISYVLEEELIMEDLNNYLADNKDIAFREIPDNLTVKHLINLTIKHLSLKTTEVDDLVFLGILIDEIENCAKMFLNLGLVRSTSENKVLAYKLNDTMQYAMQEIINRQALITVMVYLEAILNKYGFERNAENAQYPSLKPYIIQAIFLGRKLGDCVAKILVNCFPES